jgi:cell pole-organizing protein PopZ
MEEILASIRKIISEDASDAAPSAPPVAAAEPVAIARQELKSAAPTLPQPADEEEVLDLTDELEEEPAPVMVTPAPVIKAAEPLPHDDVVFQDEEVPVSVAPATPPQAEPPESSSEQGLFRAHARSAFDEAISSIEAATSAPEAPALSPQVYGEGPTLAAAFDRAVREAFDPVLRDWLSQNTPDLILRIQPALAELLDKHLPDLLANAVREEIARAKARTGR